MTTWEDDFYTGRLRSLKRQTELRIIEAQERADEPDVCMSQLLRDCIMLALESKDGHTRAVKNVARIVFPFVSEALKLRPNDIMANHLCIDAAATHVMRRIGNLVTL